LQPTQYPQSIFVGFLFDPSITGGKEGTMAEPELSLLPEVEAGLDTGLLAGVDEAGLGPILGPLVVAGVTIEGPKGRDPWDLLDRLVCRHRVVKGKVQVADSKKVHSGRYGLQRLERTLLSFWGALHNEIPRTAGDLLAHCNVDTASLAHCPWYGDLSLPLPLANNRDDLELFAHMLQRDMAYQGVQLHDLAIRPVDVEEFNTSILDTNNKGETHFHAYSDVIGRMLRIMPGNAHLVADRCGGRVHYAPGLRRHLKQWQVRTIKETAQCSVYEVVRDNHKIQISFTSRGEDRSFPTALASCAAKYVREIMMTMVNQWFQAKIPDLKRTAGYYVDGNRFLADVGELLETEGFPTQRLIRSR
jgi:ribonuclease HII